VHLPGRTAVRGARVFLLLAALTGCGKSELSVFVAAKGFVTASPVDLDQVAAFTKFRSCAGHDYEGTSTSGVHESDRSMKHYVEARPEYLGTTGQFRVYAPFAGTIDYLIPPALDIAESATLRGGSIWMNVPGTETVEDGVAVYLTVQIGHVYPLAGLQQGVSVNAGDLIGYGALNGGDELDLVVRSEPGSQEYLFSFIESMSPTVLAQYAARGVTLDNVIVSKAYRDAHPCGFVENNGGAEGAGTLSNPALDDVYLTCDGGSCADAGGEDDAG